MAMEWVSPQENGFSIVELIITIGIIGILAGIVVFTPKTFLVTARDQERTDDTTAIARRLEQAYSSQEINNYPAYPSTVELQNDITGMTRSMTQIQAEALYTPGASAKSVVSANNNTVNTPPTPRNTGEPTIGQYIYQPLTATGALCTGNPSTSAPCVRFFLHYRLEKDSVIKTIKSIHQQ